MFRRRIANCLTPAHWNAVFADRERDQEDEPVEPPALYVSRKDARGARRRNKSSGSHILPAKAGSHTREVILFRC
jgi:hypothetical protein